MMPDDPARAALAEGAALGLPVLPQLRLLCTAEALAAPAPPYALDLNAELEMLCTALRESVRRRPGWLYYAPADQCVAAAVPRRLLQAAVLCWVRGVLSLPGRQAAIHLDATPQAAVLVLRGGDGHALPGDTRALLLRLAAVCGGAVVQSGGSGPLRQRCGSPWHRKPHCRSILFQQSCSTTDTALCKFFCRNTAPDQTNDRGPQGPGLVGSFLFCSVGPAGSPGGDKTAQPKHTQAQSGKQIGQRQHTVGRFKQGLGQFQTGT